MLSCRIVCFRHVVDASKTKRAAANTANNATNIAAPEKESKKRKGWVPVNTKRERGVLTTEGAPATEHQI